MGCPQVADGETVSNMEGSCEYIESAVAEGQQGVVLQFGGVDKVIETPQPEMLIRFESFTNAKTWTVLLVRCNDLQEEGWESKE
jgi:hypothetical protein